MKNKYFFHHLNSRFFKISGEDSESFIQKAKEHPWLNKITVKVLGDNINLKNRKPFPDPYLLSLKHSELNKSECIIVENAPL